MNDDDLMPAAILDRREFTLAAVLAMLSGVAITISGCGSKSPSTPTSTTLPPAPSDKTGTIAANHGHTAVVTGAQQSAAGAVVLNIQGTAGHTHAVELSAAEVVSIRDGRQVAKDSSNVNNHMHAITFN